MPKYIVEIRMSQGSPHDRARVAQALDASRARLRQADGRAPTRVSGVTRDGPRLRCVIAAPTLEAVRQLLRIALLPPATVREASAATDAR